MRMAKHGDKGAWPVNLYALNPTLLVSAIDDEIAKGLSGVRV